MRAAFSLLFTLLGVAGLYAMLGADFLAVAQILIYVGGILIIIIFGVMLTRRIYGVDVFAPAHQLLPSAIGSLLLLFILLMGIWGYKWKAFIFQQPDPTTTQIGRLLLTKYLLPFEIASILLLAALLGAAFLTRREVR